MASFKYINTSFTGDDTSGVVRGHNKKVAIKLNPETYEPDPKGEIFYFKYDSEKEKHGNMQKRFGSAFCSYLAHKFGGNFVEDIPGTAIVRGSSKEDYSVKLDGVFSRSYRNDYHIDSTFTLDSVLKPREGEEFEYNNKHRVFASVENSMIRLKSFVKAKIAEGMSNLKYSQLNDLEADFAKIEEDLVSIVMLDYMFLNNDRHTENIEFSIVRGENGKYHLVVSPVFDNDRTFGLDKTEKDIEESLSSRVKRGIYVDLSNDLKYVIREKDCSDEFAREMNFSSNYHCDVITEYIKKQCLTPTGKLDIVKLKENNLYKLIESYKDVDIKQEFYNFLCEVIGVPMFDIYQCSEVEEQEFLTNFNRIAESTINLNHIKELTENFNIRRGLLVNSMRNMVATSTSVQTM